MIIGSDKYTIDKIPFDDVYQMSNIWRYSGRTILRPENIAEHSFYVAFFVHQLGEAYGISAERINKACKVALCHDCGEIYTGDIPHSLKVYSPEIKKISEDLECKLITENFSCFGKEFTDFMNHEDEVVTLLVELADITDAIKYIEREETLGNKDPDIKRIGQEATERFVKKAARLESILEAEKK